MAQKKNISNEENVGHLDEVGSSKRLKVSHTEIHAEASYDRGGKWTMEEEEFARAIADYFAAGMLSIEEGTLLRGHIAKKLGCDPMRVTKKITGKKKTWKGKKAYRRNPDCTSDDLRRASQDLDFLAARFVRSVQQQEAALVVPDLLLGGGCGGAAVAAMTGLSTAQQQCLPQGLGLNLSFATTGLGEGHPSIRNEVHQPLSLGWDGGGMFFGAGVSPMLQDGIIAGHCGSPSGRALLYQSPPVAYPGPISSTSVLAAPISHLTPAAVAYPVLAANASPFYFALHHLPHHMQPLHHWQGPLISSSSSTSETLKSSSVVVPPSCSAGAVGAKASSELHGFISTTPPYVPVQQTNSSIGSTPHRQSSPSHATASPAAAAAQMPEGEETSVKETVAVVADEGGEEFAEGIGIVTGRRDAGTPSLDEIRGTWSVEHREGEFLLRSACDDLEQLAPRGAAIPRVVCQ